MSETQKQPASDRFAENQGVYAIGEVVKHYADAGKLKTAEEAILRRLGPQIQGKRLLDIGVGGGRTTSHLLALSTDYIGVDYSGEMVGVCRAKYPGVNFQEADARNLEAFGRATFDFIFFSFNGIDSIDGEGRAQVLREVHAALKPGGLFLFSSHSLRVLPERPWQLSLYSWSLNPRTILYNLRRAWRSLRNYWRHAGDQSRGEGYAIVVDSGHDFRLLHYYVEPEMQVRQLGEAGFVEIEVFDQQGSPSALSAPSLDTTGHVHYLARKPVQ